MYCFKNLVLVAMLAMVAAGCNRTEVTTPPASAVSATSYDYRAYDANGVLVASGSMSLTLEGTALAGQRDIKGNAPEVGTGSITGQMRNDGMVEIMLNPGEVGLVTLKGKQEGLMLTGDRMFDTGTPPFERKIGTFVATQAMLGTDG
jgi:hypothetical protein